MKLNEHVILAGACLVCGLAAASWQLAAIPGDASTVERARPAAAREPRAAPPRQDLAQIPGWSLFGAYDPQASAHAAAIPSETTPAAPVDEQSLPDATTNVVLVGILAAPTEREARAIVADGSKAHQRYAVGDTLPGGAVIEAIHARAVVITHKGRQESMRLPDYDAGSRAAASGGPNPRPVQGNRALAARPS